MRLRPATGGDVPAIREIWNAVIRDTLITFNPVEKTEEELAALIAAKAGLGHPFLVAELDGQVTGFATYGQFRGGAGYARTMEHTIILAPASRGRGVGRVLMAALEEHARAAGVHSIFAGVSAANEAGVAFHAALGYAEVARLREVGRKAGQWLDLVLMQKFL
jgi:phosphinothricin acetyltransferase